MEDVWRQLQLLASRLESFLVTTPLQALRSLGAGEERWVLSWVSATAKLESQARKWSQGEDRVPGRCFDAFAVCHQCVKERDGHHLLASFSALAWWSGEGQTVAFLGFCRWFKVGERGKEMELEGGPGAGKTLGCSRSCQSIGLRVFGEDCVLGSGLDAVAAASPRV